MSAVPYTSGFLFRFAVFFIYICIYIFIIENWFVINNLLIKYVPQIKASSRTSRHFSKKSFGIISITKWRRHSMTRSRVLPSNIGYCHHSRITITTTWISIISARQTHYTSYTHHVVCDDPHSQSPGLTYTHRGHW